MRPQSFVVVTVWCAAIAACSPGMTLTSDAAPLDAAVDIHAVSDVSRIDVVHDSASSDASDANLPDLSDTSDATDVAGDDGAALPHVCPPVGPMDCSPGTGTGTGAECTDGPSCYLARVQAAVRAVISEHPEWFDYNNPIMCPNILNVDGYLNGVVDHLVADGLCAIRDPNAPGEEISVKFNNDFTENFDIVASTGCARYGGLIYTGYCVPGWW